MTANPISLVDEQHLAFAMRDAGYKSTSAAVAELVDNAVQAGASVVQVRVSEVGTGKGRALTVSVLDNGSGMSPTVLQQALQFGGSTRFGDRDGIGRFGMGLPSSSVSQARRLEVSTWTSATKTFYSYLDLDEIAMGTLRSVPTPVSVPRPENVSTSETGTLVRWAKCDRLDYRKAATIERKLVHDLSRVFRHIIWAGAEILVNESRLIPTDPLFLKVQSEENQAEPYFEPLTFNIRVPGTQQERSEVVVRFSRLPIREWHELPVDQKRRLGIVGGAGMAVIRAGREIAHGWHFFGSKRRQNYDDWWRCELFFQPKLDEMFGVTHTKQGIRPTVELSEIITPDIERIARRLSSETRAEFAALGRERPSTSARRATSRDWRLPRVPLPAADPAGSSVMSRLKYRIDVRENSAPDFFAWQLVDDTLVLQLNQNHCFFREVYDRVCRDGDELMKNQLDYLLLAYARAAETHPGQATKRFCTEWSNVLAAYVGE